MRTRKHYESMLESNPGTTWGLSLAAQAVYAAKNGVFDRNTNFDEDYYRKTYLRLQKKYGEVLNPEEVRNEMKIITAMTILGSRTSDKKTLAARVNGMDNRPHIVKLRHFVSIFPHHLVCNEWQDAFDLGNSTYNPDYWCEDMKCYIEVTTSKPNISEQGHKWSRAISIGVPLRVYWWEGQDITAQFVIGTPSPIAPKPTTDILKYRRLNPNAKKGGWPKGRPRKTPTDK